MDKQTEMEFTKAYYEHKDKICKHIYYRTSDWEIAEDLTQEVFFKTWRYIIETHGIDNYKKFLYRVAHNLVVEYYRKKIKFTVSLDSIKIKMITDDSNENLPEHIMERIFFEKLLSNLNENYQRIVKYRFMDEMEITDISTLTGYSPNYISVIIYRAKKILKNKMENKKNIMKKENYKENYMRLVDSEGQYLE